MTLSSCKQLLRSLLQNFFFFLFETFFFKQLCKFFFFSTMGKQSLLLFGLLLRVAMTMCLPVPGVPEDGLSHRTKRETDCNQTEEHLSQGMCCVNCPSGTYVSQPCAENHQRGSCQLCTLGESFTSGPNGLESCVSCRICRNDQVTVQECTLTSNRVCQCKPGRYCIPGEACEECLYCSRCGAGQRIKEECNATRNTVCENIPVTQPTSNTTRTYLPPTHINTSIDVTPELDVTKNVSSTTEKDISKITDPKNENGSYLVPFITVVVIFAAVLLVLFLVAVYRRYRKRKGEGKHDRANSQDYLTGSSKNTSAESSKNTTPLIERADQLRADQPPERQLLVRASNDPEQPIRAAEQTECSSAREPESGEDPGPGVDDHGGGGGGGGGGPTCDNELCSHCDQSRPCECYWTDCFLVIINHVCSENIISLVRHLRVPNSNINHIINDNKHNTSEQCYQLLARWRTQTGKKASLESVFSVLREMELGGCVENIINSLKSKNIAII